MKNIKTTIFLIRHGEIDNPNKVLYGSNINLLLNEKGKDQIKSLAKKLKKSGYKIDKIYTSPLKRALMSSGIIADVLGLKNEVLTEEDLTDASIPVIAGKPLALRKEIHESGTDEYDEDFAEKGNEAREHIVDRMKKVLFKITDNNFGKNIAIVSHGDPLQFLIYALGHPEEKRVLPMNVLVKDNYPQKGQAVKIILDQNEKLIEKEYI